MASTRPKYQKPCMTVALKLLESSTLAHIFGSSFSYRTTFSYYIQSNWRFWLEQWLLLPAILKRLKKLISIIMCNQLNSQPNLTQQFAQIPQRLQGDMKYIYFLIFFNVYSYRTVTPALRIFVCIWKQHTFITQHASRKRYANTLLCFHIAVYTMIFILIQVCIQISISLCPTS